jgi:hypothetical protein
MTSRSNLIYQGCPRCGRGYTIAVTEAELNQHRIDAPCVHCGWLGVYYERDGDVLTQHCVHVVNIAVVCEEEE